MKKKSNSKLKIIPLGGLEKIGMNITAFEYEDSIIVVDCGLSFPEDDMLGIDLVIPDISYLKSNADKVKGFVITHGHEAVSYTHLDVYKRQDLNRKKLMQQSVWGRRSSPWAGGSCGQRQPDLQRLLY